MKKRWVEPRVQVEEFMPNEYVAACYQLACGRGPENSLPYGDHWDSPEIGNVSHSSIGTPDTCGDASANRVITDDGGFFQSVGEFNGEQGWLNGGLDDVLQRAGNDDTIDPGDVIFWHTNAGGKYDRRKWNHWGVVKQQDPNHPNHS